MTTKEESRRKPGRRPPRLALTMRFCECATRFLLSAALSGAEIFGGYALFGVAMVGVTGSAPEGVAALLGAALGYLSFRGFLEGLRYVAAAMMILAVGMAAADFPIYRAPWFMPVVSAALNALVGFVYLSAGGWSGEKAVYFLTEVAMTGGAVYFFRLAFSTWEERRGERQPSARQVAGALVLGASVLMALSRITLGGRLSVGRVLAALAVMLAGWRGGAGAGAVAGVAAGLAMDLSAATVPYYIMAYSLAGVTTGAFSRQGRLFCALAYVVSAGAAVLWTWSGAESAGTLWEALAAGVVFLVLPEKLLRRFSALVRREGPREEESRLRAYAAGQLRQTAGAFRSLSESLSGLFAAPGGDGDADRLFDRAAETVCAACARREQCWQQDAQLTRNALNDALPAMLDRGEARAGDFPPWFTQRCPRMATFLDAANRELEGLLRRRSFDSRVRESRAAVCAQYGQLALMLDRAAAEVSAELAVDGKRQRQVRQRLTALGLEARCAVFYDEHHHLRLELDGEGLDRLREPEEVERLGQLLACPLRVEEGAGAALCLTEREPLMAVAGVAATRRDGMPVSGDAGAWFKDGSGRLYLLLCDGMGSGVAAREDSDGALRLLERFLLAGLSPRSALKTVGEALALKGEAEGGFTTVDLLQVDLFSGRGAVLKLGAAPTYLRRGGQVDKLAGSSLPAGLTGEMDPDVFPLELHAGDCVVMVSDGVSSGAEDGWLTQALSQFDGASPQELARRILADGRDRAAGADDRTVAVLRLDSRTS